MISRLEPYYIKNPSRDAYPTLREISFFARFADDKDLETIVKAGNWLRCPHGVEIIEEQEKGNTFYVIVKGKLSVVKGARPLGNLVKGEIFGEIGALLGEPRSAGVVSLEDCLLYEGNSLTLKQFPKQIILPFMFHLFSVTAKRLISADRRLAVL